MATGWLQVLFRNRLVWSGHSTLDRPPIMQSVVYDVIRCPEVLRPLGQAHRFSIVFNDSCVSAVARLLFASSPATIFRGVWAIVVNTFKRHTRWTLSHVCKKCNAIITPSITDNDSPGSVARIVPAHRIVAALAHDVPQIITGMVR